MNRRHRVVSALCASLIAVSLTAEAQQAAKVRRIGQVISALGQCQPERRDEAFLQGLADLGYVIGRDIAIERRCYKTSDEAHRVLGELVALKVDVIFLTGPEIALAAMKATRDIPIVCGSCGDPVEAGVVASLARTGGNITGLASLSAELIGKRVELLKETVPGVSRVAVLLFPNNPGTRATLAALDAAGRALGIKIQRVEVRTAGDLERAFKSAVAGGAGAVLVQDDPLVIAARTRIAELALKHRLPSVAGQSQSAEAGTLITYGPDRTDLFRRAASYVDKILKGAKPSDLSIEQPTKFELVINLKTAKALSIAIPQSLLLRADKVIE